MSVYVGHGKLYAVQSRSEPTRSRLVASLDDGRYLCSCPSVGGSCFHIDQVRTEPPHLRSIRGDGA